jgi:hypothetical protein
MFFPACAWIAANTTRLLLAAEITAGVATGAAIPTVAPVATAGKATARTLATAAEECVDIAAKSASGVGDYGRVLGHHVHAKRAFEGVAGYDRMKAFSVSDKTLAEFGVRHADVTVAQQRLFRVLDASGAPNTLTQHSRVAYQALVEAGVPTEAAKQLVVQSQAQLIRSGVTEPARIPWGKR